MEPAATAPAFDPEFLQFAEDYPDAAERAVQQVVRQAEAARTDPVEFFRFVMRAEDTQLGVEPAPHQVLALQFYEYHPQFVLRMPAGSSKTSMLVSLGLYELGRNPLMRGAIVSAADEQAKRPVGSMRAYIDESPQLNLVFPRLMRSTDPDAPWSDTKFVIQRPRSISHPSMRSAGIDSKSLLGSRLSWAMGDDVINGESAFSKEARDKVETEFHDKVESRLDTVGSVIGVTNTPWDQDDLTYRFERGGRPTLTMSITGDIRFGGQPYEDDGDRVMEQFWDLLRPSKMKRGVYRLLANGDDPDDQVPLWPKRFSADWIHARREGLNKMLPNVFARQLMCEPFDADSARCQREWTEAAIKLGYALMLPCKPDGARRRYTGVDVGGVKRDNDESAIVTVEARDNGMRRILNVQHGHWSGPELVKRIRTEALTYDSKVFVESNAAQRYIVDFTKAEDRRLRVVAFYTGAANKHDQWNGVESIFTELFRGLWEWPGGNGRAPDAIKELANQCVFYSPTQHMGDILAALWLARTGLARPREHDDDKGARASGRRQMVSGGGF